MCRDVASDTGFVRTLGPFGEVPGEARRQGADPTCQALAIGTGTVLRPNEKELGSCAPLGVGRHSDGGGTSPRRNGLRDPAVLATGVEERVP